MERVQRRSIYFSIIGLRIDRHVTQTRGCHVWNAYLVIISSCIAFEQEWLKFRKRMNFYEILWHFTK